MRKAGFTDVVPIPGASVPIGWLRLIPPLSFADAFSPVKFKDPDTGLECDINVNDQLGFINTSMIRRYVSLQPAMIPLLRLIKRWAKTVGMNTPSKRPVSFSSYTLTLMTIAWSQVRSQTRTSDLLRLSSSQVIGVVTESPGGYVCRNHYL